MTILCNVVIWITLQAEIRQQKEESLYLKIEKDLLGLDPNDRLFHWASHPLHSSFSKCIPKTFFELFSTYIRLVMEIDICINN